MILIEAPPPEKSGAIFYFPIPISRPLLQNQIFFCKFVQTCTAIIGADLIVYNV